MSVLLVLTALLVFQFKHFACDFVLQPYQMVIKKGIYLHPAGLLHAGIHTLASIPAVLILSRVPSAIALVLVGEFVIHYHSDWSKAQIDKELKLDDRTTLYWVIFGSDQLVHQLTYLGMTYVLVFLS